MRKLLLAILLFCLLAPPASAASSVAFSWPTNWYALTDGATISPPCPGSHDSNGVGVGDKYSLIVLGNNHTISLPSCTIPSGVIFRITQGAGGPYTGLSFSAGANTLNFTNKTAYVQTPTAGAIDDVGGQIVSSTVWDIFAAQYNLGPSTPTVVGPSVIATQCSGSGALTCSVSRNVVAGDIVSIYGFSCGSGCGSPGPNMASIAGTGIGACTEFSGYAGAAQTAAGRAYDAWWCLVTATETPATITVTYASTAYYATLAADDIHNATGTPDAGISHFANGSSATISVTTNGSAPTSSLVLSFANIGASATCTPSGTTLVNDCTGTQQSVTQSAVGAGSAATLTVGLSATEGWQTTIFGIN